jgi:hypothetical protein
MTKPVISYTNKDYEKIRAALIDYAKLYYPDVNKNFNKASFGAMVIDMASYVGDMLSFYGDYQANETFIDTAIESRNVLKLAKQAGYKDKGRPCSFGWCEVYLEIPANASGQPDTSYIPLLKQNSKFQSTNGTSFLVIEDVNFNDSDTQIVVSAVNTSGTPTKFAFKKKAKVISGELYVQTEIITTFDTFYKIKIKNTNMSEIISVLDTEGNEYYEVDYLSQNLIFLPIKNSTAATNEYAPYHLRKIFAARRFVIENINGFYNIVFGNGTVDSIKDPSNVLIDFYARDYVTDTHFDPSNILTSDKFGLAPQNTTLTIVYRGQTSGNTNVAIGGLNKVISPILEFSSDSLSATTINEIRSSIIVDNEEAILGFTSTPSSDEVRIKSIGSWGAQGRAVSKEDYINLCYRMDPKFGSIKRANIVPDRNSFKRNLNLYIISEDSNNNLITSNSILKENLKEWIERYKMINDSVDIIDAQIVNIGIEFVAQAQPNRNKYDVLTECIEALKNKYEVKLNIGEPFDINQIYKTLNLLSSVNDTKNVKIVVKNSAGYTFTNFDISTYLSADESMINIPENIILEIKNFNTDLRGTIL